ncbi:hypothetical protein POSPLADRAFT_1117032, partial [Postia placenta MAD-698-R-SB12]
KKGKAKADQPSAPVTSLVSDEVDFPRGGGSSFTPLEVKAIRAEAVKEANDELFQVYRKRQDKPAKRVKRKSDAKSAGKKVAKGEKSETVRVEHLNYK